MYMRKTIKKYKKKTIKKRISKRKKRTGGGYEQNWTIPEPQDKNTTLLFWVEGFGCGKENDESITTIKNWANKFSYIPNENIIFVCDKSYIGTIGTIAKTRLNMPPLINSKFLKAFIEAILNALNTDYTKILIFGFSYGGAVVNRLAQELNKLDYARLSKIFMATFGSIYIPDTFTNKKVSIKNYLAKGDISINYNHKIIDKNIRFNKRLVMLQDDNSEYIILDFKNPEDMNNFTLIICVLFNGKGELLDGMTIHNSYKLFALALLSGLTNNILEISETNSSFRIKHLHDEGVKEEEEEDDGTWRTIDPPI